MQVAEADYELFVKLRIKNAIELALLLPKKIHDYTAVLIPQEGQPCTQKLIIKRLTQRGRQLFATAHCPSWGLDLGLVFFNATSWHTRLCQVGAGLFCHGVLNRYQGQLQFVNPKILSQMDRLIPEYRIKGVRDEAIAGLFARYLTRENLAELGLREELIDFCLALHAYDKKSLEILNGLDHFQNSLKYLEIYNFLRRLRGKKNTALAYPIKLREIDEWLASLPFRPTADQLAAMEDVRGDLGSIQSKRRIIMGDVGCGKTLVLLAAALMVHPQQALLMAPTSILASQIYEEAKRLLPPFMNILFIKGGYQNKRARAELSTAHLIIGTHALIHLPTHEAVLVMVDEQHRFGSAQRQKIQNLNKKSVELDPQNLPQDWQGDLPPVLMQKPHFVQFSATPIPRTLSMLQSDLINFSFIKQMPFEKEITTHCIQEEGLGKFQQVLEHELAQGNQALIIYPLVNPSDTINYDSLEEARGYWEGRYPGVFITHGRDRDKDEVLARFRERGRILLSTTVVEVGISLPRLSTILIIGAERLGLATLHQLRGRVGRVGLKSQCYLYTKEREIPQRLLDFAKTLDGFKIAELDLKNRRSGDLLQGLSQHGNQFNFFDFNEDEEILSSARADLDEFLARRV